MKFSITSQNYRDRPSTVYCSLFVSRSVMSFTLPLLYVIAAVPDEFGYVRVYHRDDVKLPCHLTPTDVTNVTWLHEEKPTWSPWDIYVNGRIFKNLRDRFSINNAAVGDYSLTILNIQPTDGGRYRCFDQQQLIKNYVIYVSG